MADLESDDPAFSSLWTGKILVKGITKADSFIDIDSKASVETSLPNKDGPHHGITLPKDDTDLNPRGIIILTPLEKSKQEPEHLLDGEFRLNLSSSSGFVKMIRVKNTMMEKFKCSDFSAVLQSDSSNPVKLFVYGNKFSISNKYFKCKISAIKDFRIRKEINDGPIQKGTNNGPIDNSIRKEINNGPIDSSTPLKSLDLPDKKTPDSAIHLAEDSLPSAISNQKSSKPQNGFRRLDNYFSQDEKSSDFNLEGSSNNLDSVLTGQESDFIKLVLLDEVSVRKFLEYRSRLEEETGSKFHHKSFVNGTKLKTPLVITVCYGQCVTLAVATFFQVIYGNFRPKSQKIREVIYLIVESEQGRKLKKHFSNLAIEIKSPVDVDPDIVPDTMPRDVMLRVLCDNADSVKGNSIMIVYQLCSLVGGQTKALTDIIDQSVVLAGDILASNEETDFKDWLKFERPGLSMLYKSKISENENNREGNTRVSEENAKAAKEENCDKPSSAVITNQKVSERLTPNVQNEMKSTSSNDVFHEERIPLPVSEEPPKKYHHSSGSVGQESLEEIRSFHIPSSAEELMKRMHRSPRTKKIDEAFLESYGIEAKDFFRLLYCRVYLSPQQFKACFTETIMDNIRYMTKANIGIEWSPFEVRINIVALPRGIRESLFHIFSIISAVFHRGEISRGPILYVDFMADQLQPQDITSFREVAYRANCEQLSDYTRQPVTLKANWLSLATAMSYMIDFSK